MFPRLSSRHDLDGWNSMVDSSKTQRVSSRTLGDVFLFVLLTFSLQLTFANASVNRHIALVEHESVDNGVPFYKKSSSDSKETFNTVNCVECENKQESFQTISSQFNSSGRFKRSPDSPTIAVPSQTPKKGSFLPPNTTGKITELENQIKEMKEEINKLKNESSLSSADKIRLLVLEQTVATMKKFIDDMARDNQQSGSSILEMIERLMNTIKEYRTEIEAMRKKVEESSKHDEQRVSIEECVDAINNRDFSTAVTILNQIKDTKIVRVVRDVYDNQERNFDLLMQFTDTVPDKRKSFQLYKSLTNQAVSSGHITPDKAMALINGLRKKGLLDLQPTDDLKKEVETVTVMSNNSIKDGLKEKIKSVILNKISEKDPELREMSNKVYSFEKKLFIDAINEAAAEMYKRVDTVDMLWSIKSHQDYNKAMLGYLAVYEQMKKHYDLYENPIVTLAAHIQNLKYKDIDREIKDKVEVMKLPGSVKVLINSTYMGVCIKNGGTNEYLYGAGVPDDMSSSALYDASSRYVFTHVPRGKEDTDKWEILFIDNRFFLKNKKHREYLRPGSDQYKYDGKRRRVFTWVYNLDNLNDDNLSVQNEWKIEVFSEGVRFKSVKFNEYLFVSDLKTGDKHPVITFDPVLRKENSVWFLEDCDT